MSFTITAVGSKDTNADGVTDYVWSLENETDSDVTYEWSSGTESGTITLAAGSTTFLTTSSFADISLLNND